MTRIKHQLLWCLGGLLGLLTLVGCRTVDSAGIQAGSPGFVKDQILERWHQRSEVAIEFAASGQSRHGIVNAEGKIQHLNFTAKLWFSPPHSLRLQSHATLHGNIDMGCNDEAFWLAIKPEMSTYYWGRWDRPLAPGVIPFSPKVVLEAIGLIDIGQPETWTLKEDENYWILSQAQVQEGLTKRVFVSRVHGEIERLLYVDDNETPWVAAELSGYRTLPSGFSVPTVIHVTAWENGEIVGWTKLILPNFRFQVRDSVFQRLPPKGFEHVYDVTPTSEN